MQLELVEARQRGEIPDTLLLVEHPHVITAGRSAKRDNLLDVGDTPLFEIERGGDVTYHGPGQLVGYPIFLLRDDERDLHVYLRNLEEPLIRALARFGTRRDAQGGVDGRLERRRRAQAGVDRHRGQTLGHACTASRSTSRPTSRRFAAINPCGLDAAVMGSMSGELGRTVDMRGGEAGRARRPSPTSSNAASPSRSAPPCSSAGGGRGGRQAGRVSGRPAPLGLRREGGAGIRSSFAARLGIVGRNNRAARLSYGRRDNRRSPAPPSCLEHRSAPVRLSSNRKSACVAEPR